MAWLSAATVRPIAYVGVFVFVIAGWLVSLCLHEFGHAFTAWRFGDHDVAVRGYLTLNPLKYSNPMLSIGLPLLFIALGGIGLPGGAVYLRTGFMTSAPAHHRQPGRTAGEPGAGRRCCWPRPGCSTTPTARCSGPVSPRWASSR